MTAEFLGTRSSRPARPEAAFDLTLPWRLGDLSRLAYCEGIGLIGITLSWYGSAHTLSWSRQLVWIVGGIFSVLIAASGWTTWLLLGARNLRGRQRLLDQQLRLAIPAAQPVTIDLRDAEELVASPTMTRYHRASCALTRGKPVTAALMSEHAAAGRQRCGVCQP